MGNVTPSHRRGITNSLLSVLTSDGGCSKLTLTPVHRELSMTWGRTASRYLGNLSHLALGDTYFITFLERVPTSSVKNREGLTLFTLSLKAEHQHIIHVTVHQHEVNNFAYLIQQLQEVFTVNCKHFFQKGSRGHAQQVWFTLWAHSPSQCLSPCKLWERMWEVSFKSTETEVLAGIHKLTTGGRSTKVWTPYMKQSLWPPFLSWSITHLLNYHYLNFCKILNIY